MALNRRVRDLVVEFDLPEADYGVPIGPGVLALLAYPDERVALVAAPTPAEEIGWRLVACDPGDEGALRQAVAAVAQALGLGGGGQPVVEAAPTAVAQGLTEQQRAAVEHLGGRPARVLAGAGTGKTRVITERFRYLVESGVKPERILALTFSRPAAAQMRAEVVRHLRASATLWISTFHSFCLRIVETETAQSVRLVHEPEARAILAGLAPGVNSRQIEEAHAFIGQAKDQLLAPDHVAAYAAARGDERLTWLAGLYGRFRDELERQEAAEFGDFIFRAERLLEADPAVAARWQSRFDHILVDELQDTNLAQFKVLQMLAQPHGNLMVVGDDDQAIYRFRGATDRFMRGFLSLADGAVDYPVMENFRCPQPVLEVANRLIKQNEPEREPKELITTTKREGFPPVRHWEARTDREEADAVAAEIERRLKQGGKPSDFAILLRSVRRCGGEFARALRERSIPCKLVGETYPHPVVGQTLALLRLTQGLRLPDLLTVLAGRVEPADLFAALRAGSLLEGKGPEPVGRAFAELQGWLDGVRGLPVDELTYRALKFLGHLRLSLKPSAVELERLGAVRLMQEQAALAGSLEALLAMNAGAGTVAGSADAVTIMTVHAAKGLQFKVVFVAALAEGIFPVAVDAEPVFYLAEAMLDWLDRGALTEQSAAERLAQHIREERRLAYVALTRAEEELILTRALSYAGEAVQPTRFLAEMGAPDPVAVSGRMGDLVGAARAFLVEAASGIRRAGMEQVAAAASVLKADPGALPLRRQADPAPFGGSDSLRLSASAIELYRDCPRKYYYAYVLRLPDQDNVYTAFGSALHGALESFNRMRLAGSYPEWADLERFWEEAMLPGPFDAGSQYRQLRERGRLFLQRYYQGWAAAPRPVASVEGAFQFDYTDGQGRTHLVRGRYDLIERDAAGNEIIIDYKSGTMKSTNVTKGVRMTPNHPQRKLQLGLYYLARFGGQVKPGAKVSYVFLKHVDDKAPAGWVPEWDPGVQTVACEHTADSLRVIRDSMDAVIDGILANRFERNIEERKCETCPFRDACEVSKRAYF